MVVAVIELGATASHQAAVVATPTRLAAASLFFNVAFSVSITVVGAIGFFTIVARVVWLTETSSIIALTIRSIAPTWTSAHGTVQAIKAGVTMAKFREFVANAIAAAVIGTSLLFDLTFETNQAHGASAFTFVALTTIIVAVGRAGLVRARRPLPPNLTETRCIVTAVTIIAIGANRLRAVYAPVAHVTLALSCNTITTPMTTATVGAHLLLTSLAHVTRCTIADAVDAPAVI